MSNHTPGPWEIVEISNIAEDGKYNEEFDILDNKNGKFIVEAMINKADAHLIAAAPDLLKQLKFAERWVTIVAKTQLDQKAIQPIRDAIKKAEGND